MADAVAAVDIGGTKTTVALVDPRGEIVERATASTPGRVGGAAIVDLVAALTTSLLDRHGASLRGVGVGTAGVVDTSTGTIVSATDTLRGWIGMPLRSTLRAALGAYLEASAPISVQNDVDAHALGEYRFGAGREASSLLTVAVGTGVGGGIVLDGRSWNGGHHVAGEIAHMPTPGAEHLRCPCGRMGHLEAIGGGLGLVRHYRWLGGDSAVTDARAVAARAADDLIAERAIADAGAAVGRALAGAATLLDPEVIVVTGGVADIGPVWWHPMEAAFRASVIDALASVPVRPGALGADAPLRGAAASAWADVAVTA